MCVRVPSYRRTCIRVTSMASVYRQSRQWLPSLWLALLRWNLRLDNKFMHFILFSFNNVSHRNYSHTYRALNRRFLAMQVVFLRCLHTIVLLDAFYLIHVLINCQ